MVAHVIALRLADIVNYILSNLALAQRASSLDSYPAQDAAKTELRMQAARQNRAVRDGSRVAD